MSGIPEFNFPTFAAVADATRLQGIAVISPGEHDLEVCPDMRECDGYAEGDVVAFAAATGFDYAEALTWDTIAVAECDAIIMLPGWEGSTGARHERYVAEACGKRVLLAGHNHNGWYFDDDPEQKRMKCVLMSRLGGVEARVG